MLREQVRSGIKHVGLALREPEEFARRSEAGEVWYPWWVWLSLGLTAVLGTTTYGMTMGLLGGPAEVLSKGLLCTLAAGLAWGIPLPALYILNSLSGARLSAGSTLLAALVTTSWGGLAMIASIPINWFFTAAIPHPGFVLLVNLTVFAGVGVAMIDVFQRVMRRLEPERQAPPTWWLVLVAAIGTELFYSFGLFHFAPAQITLVTGV
ncbi:MAG: hypothetical protein ACM3U2_00465 [Deltaproteobacteria bacterium]